jgi:hypothetical protein
LVYGVAAVGSQHKEEVVDADRLQQRGGAWSVARARACFGEQTVQLMPLLPRFG